MFEDFNAALKNNTNWDQKIAAMLSTLLVKVKD